LPLAIGHWRSTFGHFTALARTALLNKIRRMSIIRTRQFPAMPDILWSSATEEKLCSSALKQSELVPPGFAGGAFKYLDGHYSLELDTIYPQRVIAGKTKEQIYSETMKTAMPTEGYCFFNDANFSKLTQISCIAKAESEDTNISYNLTFEISDITVKRYNE